MTDTWRLFVAIELPDNLREELASLQSTLIKTLPEKAVRWVKPDGIHLTLKFLGDVPVAQIEEIKAALARSVKGHNPLRINAVGLGCFPNTRRPNVIWVGIEGDIRALKDLRNSVEHEIAPLGYPTEERSFNPHLTMGRTDRRSGSSDLEEIGLRIEAAEAGWLGSCNVQSVSLIRSQLQPGGSVYTTLASYSVEPSS